MSLDAAAEVLEAADPDRLAALLTLPPADRPRLIALHALGVELARAPLASAEPMLAEIRLQWWIEALQALPRTAGQHPVLQAVSEAWGQGAKALAALGEGHRRACEAEAMTLPEALIWVDATAGALTWTAAQALGATEESAIRAQGRALGVAAALRRPPRGLPESLHPALREAGVAAARQAAGAARKIGRGPVASVLYGGPAVARSLTASPCPNEFFRRFSLARFGLTRDWRIAVGR